MRLTIDGKIPSFTRRAGNVKSVEEVHSQVMQRVMALVSSGPRRKEIKAELQRGRLPNPSRGLRVTHSKSPLFYDGFGAKAICKGKPTIAPAAVNCPRKLAAQAGAGPPGRTDLHRPSAIVFAYYYFDVGNVQWRMDARRPGHGDQAHRAPKRSLLPIRETET